MDKNTYTSGDSLIVYYNNESDISAVVENLMKEGWSDNIEESVKVILKKGSDFRQFRSENPNVRLHRHTKEGQFFYYRTVHK